MGQVSETRTRRIDAASDEIERADLLVHALAQLPDDVTLKLSDQLPDRARLELLAAAYGIDDRVSFEAGEKSAAVRADSSTMAELIHEFSDPNDPPASCRTEDEVLAGQRIAFVTNLPAPYRVALLSRMSRRLTRAGAEFRAFFTGTRSRGRPWIGAGREIDFQSESLWSLELPLRRRPPLLPLNLESRLGAFRPTIVLVAGFSPAVAARAARYAHRHGAAFGIFSGEIASRGTSTGRLRRFQRRRLAHRADFAVAYGFRAGEYLRELRADLPLVYGRNTSDAYGLERRRPARPQTVQLLAVADMASRGKGIDVLVDALAALPGLPCFLTVVGPHAQESGLEARAEADDRISFVGALPQRQVRERYWEADVFLFPSNAEADVFGLALVEAMGSGLAPVVSSSPGAAGDLGVDGWNCILVGDRTPRAWAEAIERVVLDHDLRLSLGEHAEGTITSRWTMDHSCDSFIAGLRLGVLVTGPKPA
jgi:glycosyltransferase involved in cell wall biosynthesis